MSIFRATAGGAAPPAPEDTAAVEAPRAGPRRIGRGTEQQEALWAGLVEGSGHVLAEARAGAGKSSSCREAMWRMLDRSPSKALRYVVFNRANADEFRAACPPNVEVATSHSFGFAALKAAFRSQVEKNKTYLILDESPAGRNLPRYLRKSVAMLTGHAKNAMLDPRAENGLLDRQLRDLALHYDVNTYGRPHLVTGWAADVLERSAAWVELVDFDDMLWLAALHNVSFPDVDALFCDEAQDFNACQQRLLAPMCRSGRVVLVGDRFQAVNIFRGADEDSLPHMAAQLGGALATFPLTITFRCPKAHVRLANELVPDLRAHEAAPEGVVETDVLLERALAEVEPGHLVLSPTNGAAVSGALKLIGQSRPTLVRGRAVGDQLVTILRGLDGPRTVSEAAKGVDVWQNRELNRLALLDGVEDAIESVMDRAMGLQAILSACGSPAEAEPLIGRLFSDERGRAGVVTFSTIHRAKGDEADTVWLLKVPTRAPKRNWEFRQMRNLRYVALTRSKRRLVFVEPAK